MMSSDESSELSADLSESESSYYSLDSGESSGESSGSEDEVEEAVEDNRRPNKRDWGYVETNDDARFVASDNNVEFVDAKPHIRRENIVPGKRSRTKSERFTIVQDDKAERKELANAEDCELLPSDISRDDLALFSLAIRDFSQSRSVRGFFASPFCRDANWKDFVEVAKKNAGREICTNFSEDHFNELIACAIDNRPLRFVRKEEALVTITQCYFCCLKRTCSFSVCFSNSHMPKHSRCEDVGPECAALAQAVLEFIHGLIKVSSVQLTRLHLIEIERLHTAIMQAQEDKSYQIKRR